MLSIMHLIQIYKIAKQWFDFPIIVVITCIIGTTVVIMKRRKIIGFAVRIGSYLGYMALSKEYVGNGQGHILFNKILPNIKSLNVKMNNDAVIRFYEPYGFRIKKVSTLITGKQYLMVKE